MKLLTEFHKICIGEEAIGVGCLSSLNLNSFNNSIDLALMTCKLNFKRLFLLHRGRECLCTCSTSFPLCSLIWFFVNSVYPCSMFHWHALFLVSKKLYLTTDFFKLNKYRFIYLCWNQSVLRKRSRWYFVITKPNAYHVILFVRQFS